MNKVIAIGHSNEISLICSRHDCGEVLIKRMDNGKIGMLADVSFSGNEQFDMDHKKKDRCHRDYLSGVSGMDYYASNLNECRERNMPPPASFKGICHLQYLMTYFHFHRRSDHSM